MTYSSVGVLRHTLRQSISHRLGQNTICSVSCMTCLLTKNEKKSFFLFPEFSHFCLSTKWDFTVYTLLQEKCTLVSSSSPSDPGSLTLAPGHVKFVKWSWELLLRILASCIAGILKTI